MVCGGSLLTARWVDRLLVQIAALQGQGTQVFADYYRLVVARAAAHTAQSKGPKMRKGGWNPKARNGDLVNGVGVPR